MTKVLVIVVLLLASTACQSATAEAEPAATTRTPTTPPAQVLQAPQPPPITYPPAGGRRWSTVGNTGPVVGHGGGLWRYRVAVEQGIEGITADEFAAAVAKTLADPRGWTATGRFRLQQVGPQDHEQFTVYLATPATRDHLCDAGYDRYTSCRNGKDVVVNVARWANGVPHFAGMLDQYRDYVVNHEIGHRLGYGHELCPGAGRPAPLMQQQTLGMHGCVPNPWPIVDGSPYHGRSGQYSDPIPRE
jgi:hypothetical protein